MLDNKTESTNFQLTEGLKQALLQEVNKRIPARFPCLVNKPNLFLVSLVGSHNYGTAKDSSDLDIRVVYSENIVDNFKIHKPGNLSFTFNSSIVFEGKTYELDLQFIHISKYLTLLSKSNYTALEILTTRYPIYSYLEDYEIANILDYYDVNKVRANLISMLKSNKEGENNKHYKRYIRDLTLFTLLPPNATKALYKDRNVWDMSTSLDLPKVEPIDELFSVDVDTYTDLDKYNELLNKIYFSIAVKR